MIKVPFDDTGVRELVLHLGFDGSGHIGGRGCLRDRVR